MGVQTAQLSNCSVPYRLHYQRVRGLIPAAYFGLKKRAAMADFKQRFLLRNPEQGLQMDLSLLNIAKGLQGGVNDQTQLFSR